MSVMPIIKVTKLLKRPVLGIEAGDNFLKEKVPSKQQVLEIEGVTSKRKGNY